MTNLEKMLQPDSQYVFYDDKHGFCINTDDVLMLFKPEEEEKQVKGGWIPCSERLPKYRKLVDVTTRDLRVKLAYLDSIEEDGTDDLWVMPLEDAECALWNITAWMPRPKPWEGVDDEADKSQSE